MNANESFVSALGPTIVQYVGLKQALGRRFDCDRSVLASLDAFLAAEGSELSADTFAGWCDTQRHLRSGVRRRQMQIVRNLALFHQRQEPTCFVPDPLLFPSRHQTVRPYIFTHGEVAKLLEVAKALKPCRDNPVRAKVFTLALTLLYTTGLRRGELLRMTIGDFDVRERALLVRESKFHKSRLLPLSADGVLALEHYLQARRTRRLRVSPETPLVWNHCGGVERAYTPTGFVHVVNQLLEATGIRKPDGRLPRINDFRHTFACHALLRWYRAGEDVQAKLPFLATYMGHVSIVSTEYYLRLTEPVASCASERFADRYAGLIRPFPIPQGGNQ